VPARSCCRRRGDRQSDEDVHRFLGFRLYPSGIKFTLARNQSEAPSPCRGRAAGRVHTASRAPGGGTAACGAARGGLARYSLGRSRCVNRFRKSVVARSAARPPIVRGNGRHLRSHEPGKRRSKRTAPGAEAFRPAPSIRMFGEPGRRLRTL
jgi:hypothetical protein